MRLSHRCHRRERPQRGSTSLLLPQEGNAYYNAIRYDPTPTAGAPVPAPAYYALLLFARLAQGTTGLRPVTIDSIGQAGAPVTAWEVRASRSTRRLFLINKSSAPVTIDVQAPAARVEMHRMTPYDATGEGHGLDADAVRIDGQSVGADGTFRWLEPAVVKTHGGHLPVAMAPGEAAVVTLHDHADRRDCGTFSECG